jgi:hypothetical protein
MAHIFFRSFKTNREIETFYRQYVAVKHQDDRRKAVRMCVIDDQPFAPFKSLTGYGYQIVHLGDIKTIADVADFDLILCDIIGVGSALDNKLQGAAIIAEVKSAYPEKTVIAYTGATMNNPAAKQALAFSDELIKKDDSIDRWKTVLDRNIAKILNPYEIWERIRLDLIRNRIDTRDIIIFEDAYVRSIVSRDQTFHLLKEALNSSSLKGDVRSVITGVISSAIFGLIMA